MIFVGLLSGGKDSCYNIERCLVHGHELACLANLMPAEADTVEMHSWMYQSAAHLAIPAQAECIGVPLLREAIRGKAVEQGLQYCETENDEVEDLAILLQRVKDSFPHVKGVSCGAIISSYQRTRLEHVCERLGLTPLCYLWERDREFLLHEMVERGVRPVLVKVAGAGLKPHVHLGKEIGHILPSLERLHERFGLDLCGEGGEYETLVVGASFFKRFLSLDTVEVHIDQEDDSVGNLDVTSCSTITNDAYIPPTVETSGEQRQRLLCPLVASTVIDEVATIIAEETVFFSSQPLALSSLPSSSSSSSSSSLMGLPTEKSMFLQTPLIFPTNTEVGSADEQMKQVMSLLAEVVGTDVRDACFVHLYIADVSLFAAVNQRYCQYFDQNPPARSCVAVPLPQGVLVAADAFVCRGSHASSGAVRRRVMHIRSISEWAPVCIGPYSQANLLGESLALIAGQIALDPARMEIFPALTDTAASAVQVEHVAEQLALCIRNATFTLQGLRSVALEGASTPVPPVACLLSCTVYVNLPLVVQSALGDDWHRLASLARALLSTSFDENAHRRKRDDDDNDDDDDDDDDGDDDDDAPIYASPPLLLVGISGVPKNSLVEVEFVGCPYPRRVKRISPLMAMLMGGDDNQDTADAFISCVGVCSIPMHEFSTSGDGNKDPSHLARRAECTVRGAISDALSGCGHGATIDTCVLRVYYPVTESKASTAVKCMDMTLLGVPNATMVSVPVLALVPGHALSVHMTITAVQQQTTSFE